MVVVGARRALAHAASWAAGVHAARSCWALCKARKALVPVLVCRLFSVSINVLGVCNSGGVAWSGQVVACRVWSLLCCFMAKPGATAGSQTTHC